MLNINSILKSKWNIRNLNIELIAYLHFILLSSNWEHQTGFLVFSFTCGLYQKLSAVPLLSVKDIFWKNIFWIYPGRYMLSFPLFQSVQQWFLPSPRHIGHASGTSRTLRPAGGRAELWASSRNHSWPEQSARHPAYGRRFTQTNRSI